MEDVEKALSEGERNEGSSSAVADVDHYVSLTDVNRLEVQSRVRISSESSEIRVQRLLCGHRLPINAQVSDGVDDALEVCS